MSSSPTPKYRMSFGTGGQFLNESVEIARLFQDIGDWSAVKRAAAESAVIPVARFTGHSVSSEVRRGKV